MADPTTSSGLGILADRTFAAVLFDLDGTLIDSTPVVERAWRQWAAEFGLDLAGAGAWHGVPAHQTVTALLPAGRRDEGIRRINELELADVDGVVALPGAVQALAAVRGARVAIVTSCIRPLADVRLAAAGLSAPDVLVTADQVAIGKPDPAPFLLAARRLGVDPADCLVVEDAPAGLTAARAAGTARLAVVTTTSPDRLEADAVVADLSAVRFTASPAGIRVSLA